MDTSLVHVVIGNNKCRPGLVVQYDDGELSGQPPTVNLQVFLDADKLGNGPDRESSPLYMTAIQEDNENFAVNTWHSIEDCNREEHVDEPESEEVDEPTGEFDESGEPVVVKKSVKKTAKKRSKS